MADSITFTTTFLSHGTWHAATLLLDPPPTIEVARQDSVDLNLRELRSPDLLADWYPEIPRMWWLYVLCDGPVAWLMRTEGKDLNGITQPAAAFGPAPATARWVDAVDDYGEVLVMMVVGGLDVGSLPEAMAAGRVFGAVARVLVVPPHG